MLSAQGTATITAQAVQGGVKGNAAEDALLTLASTVVGVSTAVSRTKTFAQALLNPAVPQPQRHVLPQPLCPRACC